MDLRAIEAWVADTARHLPADDAEKLQALWEMAARPSPSERRRLRLVLRDAAIGRAVAFYPPASARETARRMASDLRRPATTSGPKALAMLDILRLNEGEAPGASTIRAVLGRG